MICGIKAAAPPGALFCLLALLPPPVVLGQDINAVYPYLGGRYFASAGLFRPDQDMELGLDATVDVPAPDPAPYVDFSESFAFSDSRELGLGIGGHVLDLQAYIEGATRRRTVPRIDGLLMIG